MILATASGRLGRAPETRQAGDYTILEFPLAVDTYKKGEKGTDWYKVEVWGEKRANALMEHLAKGTKVFVVGELKQEKYTKDGVEKSALVINASQVDFASGGAPAAQKPVPPPPPPKPKAEDLDAIFMSEDEIPF